VVGIGSSEWGIVTHWHLLWGHHAENVVWCSGDDTELFSLLCLDLRLLDDSSFLIEVRCLMGGVV
jgi:hypothetical protein